MEGHKKERDRYVTDTIGSKIRSFSAETIYKLKKKVGRLDALEWKEDAFDLDAALQSVSGPIIEIGGPTFQGYRIVDLNKLRTAGKDVYVTDVRETRGIDAQVDGQQMPFANNSIGALFDSALPIEGFDKDVYFREVGRVLENNGLYVTRSTWKGDYERAIGNGLKLRQYEWELSPQIRDIFNRSGRTVDGESIPLLFEGIQAIKDTGEKFDDPAERDWYTLGGETGNAILVYQKVHA